MALVRSVVLAVVALCAHPAMADEAHGLEPTGTWDMQPVGTAPTPPMGWNSWNAFHLDLTEAGLIASAHVLVDGGFAALGYRTVNIDDGWWLKRRQGDGRLQVRTNVFPDAALAGGETSLRPWTDRLHAMGLKAGIYTDVGRNACSQAWSSDPATLPQGTRDEREVGLAGHVDQDIALYFATWNFDYIKVDGCGIAHYGADRHHVANGTFRALAPLINDTDPGQDDIPATRARYAEVRDALWRVRPRGDFVLSLCNWGTANVRDWGRQVGTMWRTSGDIDPTWGRMLHNFDSVATREFYAGPGHWNDPDMLEVGNGAFDGAHLTEARAHMALWAIEAAPLIIGTDLAAAPPAIRAILANPEVIAVDQDPAGHQGVIAYADDEREIVVKTLSVRGTKAVLLFNRLDEPTTITLTAQHLKMADSTPIALRDLTMRRDMGTMTGMRRFALAPHEALLLRAVGTPRLTHGWYLAELPGRIAVAADGIVVPQPDPTIHRMIDSHTGDTTGFGPRPTYYGWGAPRADATVFSETLTLAGQPLRDGIGVEANSRLQLHAEGAFAHFAAHAGVDDSTRGRKAGVRFEVWGDGHLLAKSAEQHFGVPPADISADITGVKVVELVARQVGADDGPVLATWGEARVE
ncbi:NPCBM/NEW2 domain-containing protein [Novosphingobium sp. FSW06-99]|uniref:NPCBM/NEW2 domain-containing protein n=1 Tax=Novosphingobium sp. FSW06-99 TaxID=1739113 RepID=UPI00076D29E9|nr:NPCBM/NEW2 domain-containing protein [Novosphingobium sp. FSW06-99]KUR80212.1 alpha-galactosidase [Novosphingobium sp. FSW06-99]